MFIWLFSIMLPVFSVTNDAVLAFKVGFLAHFIGGIVFIIGAFVVPHTRVLSIHSHSDHFFYFRHKLLYD